MTLERFKSEVTVHYRAMYRVALALLRQPDDAADAVQEAMVRLWDNRGLLDGVADMRAYCCGTVRNEALSRLRRQSPVENIGDREAPDTADETDRVEQRDELSRVRAAVDVLPEPQRTVMRMNAYGGCSGREIAEATGLSEANVRAILSRTRRQLRTLFSR